MSTVALAAPVAAAQWNTLPTPARLSLAPAPPTLHAGQDAGSVSGGGGLKLFGINIGRMAMFAGLGAMAAMYIPPLAFLGGPIAGAIAGAVLSLII